MRCIITIDDFVHCCLRCDEKTVIVTDTVIFSDYLFWQYLF